MNSISDKELKYIFDTAKQEVPDRGFSRRVMHRLPQDQQPAYQWIVWFCGAIGLLIACVSGGLREFIGYLATFGRMVADAQMPNLSASVIYLLVLGGMIGFSIAIYRKSGA